MTRTHLSSFIEFSAYSLTSAVQSLVGSDLVPIGGCTTTTGLPVITTARTIKINTSLSGTDLDNFAATQIEHLLGFSDCFANAVLATPISERSSRSIGSELPSSTSEPLPSRTSQSAATILGFTPSPSSPRLQRPAVIALSTMIPIATALLLLSGVLFYRRRRLRFEQTSSPSTSAMKNGEYTPVTMLKPELHVEQSRHELPAEPSRFEISGKSENVEDRHRSPSECTIQELRDVEPSGELSTSRVSKTSLR